MAMRIEDKLACNRFHVDNDYVHIEINKECKDMDAIQKVVLACPAKLYRVEDGVLKFSYEGCLECGTCRVLGGKTVLKSWNHPIGGMGVEFRMG